MIKFKTNFNIFIKISSDLDRIWINKLKDIKEVNT